MDILKMEIDFEEVRHKTDLELVMENPVVIFIVKLIKNKFNKTTEELAVKSRKKELVIPRQVALYLFSRYTKHSLTLVASIYKRNHATVVHSKKVIKNYIDTEPPFKEMMDKFDEFLFKYKMDLSKIEKTRAKSKKHVFNKLLKASSVDDKEKWIEKFEEAI